MNQNMQIPLVQCIHTTKLSHHITSRVLDMPFASFAHVHLIFDTRKSRPLSKVWVWMNCTASLEAWLYSFREVIDRLNTSQKEWKQRKLNLDNNIYTQDDDEF